MNRTKKPKIIVTRAVPRSVANALTDQFSVLFSLKDTPFSNKELKHAFENADGVLCTVSDRITSKILDSKKRRASIISNYGVGVSNIDINYCKRLGVVVTNTPNVLTHATAEIALFLILAVSRRTTYLEAKLRKKLWKGFSIVEDLGLSLYGKTLGIIGMGRIGQATAKKVISSLGMEVVFFNRSLVNDLSFDAKQLKSLDEVLRCSDVLSVHAPGGGQEPILTQRHFALMKKSAFLINTARGDVIDQQALINSLKSGQISGAGLDVYLDEPEVPRELLFLDNVTLLPHIGSATNETREAMGMLAVNNLKAHFFDNDYPSRVV